MCDLWKLELEELQDIQQGRRQSLAAIMGEFIEPPHRRGYNLEEVLASGVALCEASQHSGNPIQFYL